MQRKIDQLREDEDEVPLRLLADDGHAFTAQDESSKQTTPESR